MAGSNIEGVLWFIFAVILWILYIPVLVIRICVYLCVNGTWFAVRLVIYQSRYADVNVIISWEATSITNVIGKCVYLYVKDTWFAVRTMVIYQSIKNVGRRLANAWSWMSNYGRDATDFGIPIWSAKQQVALIKKAEQPSVRNVEINILNKLKQNLSRRKKVALTEQPWRPGLASEGTPVIVFCVYSSRLGVDIESAMRGVQGDAKVVLVVLHPKLRRLLRGDLSSEEDLLNSALINRMSAIAHFAFSDHEGLYTCHQNDTGSEKLLNSLIGLQ